MVNHRDKVSNNAQNLPVYTLSAQLDHHVSMPVRHCLTCKYRFQALSITVPVP